jgi:hypothetical protein
MPCLDPTIVQKVPAAINGFRGKTADEHGAAKPQPKNKETADGRADEKREIFVACQARSLRT